MGEDNNNQGMAEAISPWGEFKKKLNEAVVGGIGRYIQGPGKPGKVFNPFQALTDPTTSYRPSDYKGIGGMGERLRLIEDEKSPPMTALKTAIEKNPLLKGMQTEVPPPGALGANVSGSMSWTPKGPVVSLAPIVSPTDDPGMTATHEVLGHGSHGYVSGLTPEQQRNIRPRLEGLATGAERGIYKPLGLDLPSGYEQIYGNRSDYRNAQDQGAQVAQHIAETGEVVPQEAVVDGLFGGGNPLPLKKAPVAMNGGS